MLCARSPRPSSPTSTTATSSGAAHATPTTLFEGYWRWWRGLWPVVVALHAGHLEHFREGAADSNHCVVERRGWSAEVRAVEPDALDMRRLVGEVLVVCAPARAHARHDGYAAAPERRRRRARPCLEHPVPSRVERGAPPLTRRVIFAVPAEAVGRWKVLRACLHPEQRDTAPPRRGRHLGRDRGGDARLLLDAARAVPNPAAKDHHITGPQKRQHVACARACVLTVLAEPEQHLERSPQFEVVPRGRLGFTVPVRGFRIGQSGMVGFGSSPYLYTQDPTLSFHSRNKALPACDV